jgi:phosphatidate phosphatase LPIN
LSSQLKLIDSPVPNTNFTKKFLVPTSEMLSNLKLNLGINKISYHVSCSWRGAQKLTGTIYYLPKDVKIVVSDFDGTITKSDLLGHVMPIFGKDWTHSGVAQLYSNIGKNGYLFLYMSSRPIGLAEKTRTWLKNLKQEGIEMPVGPVLTSPDRSLDSLKREMITQKPDVFKFALLREIKKVFPNNINPFYAGFGNKDTDAIAYRAIDIPMDRIFLINSKGSLLQLNNTEIASYTKLNELITNIFPTLATKNLVTTQSNISKP